MTKTTNLIKAINLGEHSSCNKCKRQCCICIERQDGTWENHLPIIEIEEDSITAITLKTFLDGDQFCCMDGENLQESKCIGWGKTRKDAVNDYFKY